MANRHPCGNSPTISLQVSLWWCYHHQCLHSWEMAVYEGAGEPELLHTHQRELGPFDHVDELTGPLCEDIRQWARDVAVSAVPGVAAKLRPR